MKIVFTILAFLLLFKTDVSAQQFQQANLTEKGVIVLPEGKPVESTYLLDMSSLNFKTDEEMLEFLSTKSTPNYSLRARTAERKAVLILNLHERPGWTIKQWNEQLKTSGEKQPLRK